MGRVSFEELTQAVNLSSELSAALRDSHGVQLQVGLPQYEMLQVVVVELRIVAVDGRRWTAEAPYLAAGLLRTAYPQGQLSGLGGVDGVHYLVVEMAAAVDQPHSGAADVARGERRYHLCTRLSPHALLTRPTEHNTHT